MPESKRKDFSHYIVNQIENCGLKLLNQNDIRSRGNFNQYQINYESSYSIPSLKPHLIVETEVSIQSFPSAFQEADCILYQYLKGQNRDDIVTECRLEPFLVKTQSLERTYIDKIFAICDYYLASNLKEHSRHIYDLHKIHPLVQYSETFINLINEVRAIRSENKMCLSAQPGRNVTEVIHMIIEEDIYKKDYNDITRDLLFENVKYEEVIGTLNTIMNAGIF